MKLKRCGLRQHTAQLAVVKLCVKASKRALKLLVSPLSFAATNQGRIAVVVIQGPCTPCTCQQKLEYTKGAFGKGSSLQIRQFLDPFCTTSISKTHTHTHIYVYIHVIFAGYNSSHTHMLYVAFNWLTLHLATCYQNQNPLVMWPLACRTCDLATAKRGAWCKSVCQLDFSEKIFQAEWPTGRPVEGWKGGRGWYS